MWRVSCYADLCFVLVTKHMLFFWKDYAWFLIIFLIANIDLLYSKLEFTFHLSNHYQNHFEILIKQILQILAN